LQVTYVAAASFYSTGDLYWAQALERGTRTGQLFGFSGNFCGELLCTS